jgi:hypothetical protein
MTDYAPGDKVIYRDGDRYFVARIELVRGGYYTATPYNPLRRGWANHQRRIARDFVLSRVAPTTQVQELVARIERLRNERDARRLDANRWLRECLIELTQAEELT